MNRVIGCAFPCQVREAAAQDIHIQHLPLQDCLRFCITKEFMNKFSSACSSFSLGLDLTAVHCHNQLEWANYEIQWWLALWIDALFTDESHFFHCLGQIAFMASVDERYAWCQCCESSGPLWGWANEHSCLILMLFLCNVWDTAMRSWGPLLWHYVMLQHECMAPCCKALVHITWKLKTLVFAWST